MTTWKIVADTGSDIRSLEHLGEGIQYDYVPLILTVDDIDFVDDENLNMAQFEDHLRHTKQESRSACPAPERYRQAFEGADHVICFTISSALSGSYNAANLAKQMIIEKDPSVKIHIFDTRSAGTEMNLLVYKAIENIQAGMNFEENVPALNTYHEHTNVNFILKSVRNLVNNGRVNRLLGQMVGLLKINLIGERTVDGKIDLADRARGEKKAYRVTLDTMKKNGYQGGKVEVSHASNLTGAEDMVQVIQKEFPEAECSILPMSALCTFYAELGGLIIGYETK